MAKEFEGVITYHEFEFGVDPMPTNDTVQIYYSHGNFVGIHSSKSSSFHVVKDYYFQKDILRLYLFNENDSLYKLKLTNPIEKLISFSVKKNDGQILSQNCETVTINSRYDEKDSTTFSDFNITFSRGFLNVDKSHFKNWNLGFFNKFIAESGAYFLKYDVVHFDSSHKRLLSGKSYQVISVDERPVDPAIFRIDPEMISK
jgi:hypothetical protein